MSIINVSFEKNIKNINNNLYIQIIFPELFNNISYKIYGSKNFIYTGSFKINNNHNLQRIPRGLAPKAKTQNAENSKDFLDSRACERLPNILNVPINKIQSIFISIINNNTTEEYFDFIEMKDFLKKNYFKNNIKLNVIRKNNINMFNINKKNIDNGDNEKDDSDEEDSDEEDSDEEDSDEEDSDEEDSKKEDSDEDEKDSDEEDCVENEKTDINAEYNDLTEVNENNNE